MGYGGFKKVIEGKVFLTRGLVGKRYQKNPRTIKRWEADPRVGFPPPDLTILDRVYWNQKTLDAYDRRQRHTAKQAKTAPK
jgi:hypothetical protein